MEMSTQWFPFGVSDWTWNSVVSVPEHCRFIYLVYHQMFSGSTISRKIMHCMFLCYCVLWVSSSSVITSGRDIWSFRVSLFQWMYYFFHFVVWFLFRYSLSCYEVVFLLVGRLLLIVVALSSNTGLYFVCFSLFSDVWFLFRICL